MCMATSLSLFGQNGLSYPITDSTAGGSIAIGVGALAYQNTLASTDFANTAIGYQTVASASMTTAATANTAVGFRALTANATGNDNTALGTDAMYQFTGGASNTAVGSHAKYWSWGW